MVDRIREDLNDYVQKSCKATILIVKSRGMAYESIGNYEMAGMYYHNRELMSVYEYMEERLKRKEKTMKKLSKDYILRTIAGEKVVVPTGSAVQRFNGLITLNDVAGFIWECLENNDTKEEIVQKILEEYEVEEATAVQDVNGFTQMLEEQGILVEE